MEHEYENYDPSFPDQAVVDQYLPVWASLPSFRSKPAFIWSHQDSNTQPTHLTYAQLNASANHISSQLLTTLQRRETVLVLCSPGLDFVELIFGCQRAGLLAVTSFAYGNCHHLIRVISQTKPKAAIAHSTYIASIQQYYTSSSNSSKHYNKHLASMSWISIEDVKHGNLTTANSNNNNNNNNFGSLTYNGCRETDVYLVQYTSGATGVPKPVLVTAGSAAHNVRTARKVYDLHPNSVIVSWLPQYHDAGLVFLLLTVVCGATCVLTSPHSFIKRPRLWVELISEFNATCTPVPSFALPLVMKRGRIDRGTLTINLSSLKNLILINEPIYRDLVEDFVHAFAPFGLSASSISPSYGLAENCTFVSTSWRGHDSDAHSSFYDFPTHNKLLPVAVLSGENDEDISVVVVNEETHVVVEDGVEGEIWVASPSNASGYLGHPSLTRQVFQARIRNTVGRCFLRTGDTGIVKGKPRYLYVTGRCHDLIKLHNGESIHPHYIETAAHNSSPKLLRPGCAAAFKAFATVAIVAELQRVDFEKATGIGLLRSVCEGIRESVLRKENVEVGWVVLVKSECVPKTTSGKLQRWAAREKLLGGKMTVVTEMRFRNDVVMGRKVAAAEENDDIITCSFLSAETRSSLLSLL